MSSDPIVATPPHSEAADLPPPVRDLYLELHHKIQKLRPNEDLSLLQKAFDFAAKRHGKQTRSSGEPYMIHPLMVTNLLADMNMDMVCLQTGLLHDVVEDTGASILEIRNAFGEEVARCVDGVTKLSKLNFYSAEARQAESFRKMLLAMVTDIRVIIVKLADRVHNMRTLQSLPRDKQERIARETLDIYGPIAHRLGMGKIRGELEDLAFAYLEPEAADELHKVIESRRRENEEYLSHIRGIIEAKLAAEGIPARVEGRIKRAYSVYHKMKRQRIGIDQVYDLLALRIITDSVKNCYAALGVLHHEWHPIPGRIKDFIAIPRRNLYQSLHTSVIGPGGRAFEVQIRTDEMHRVAEEGIAAHWKYKEGHTGHAEDDQRIAWLRQLVEWQQEMRDPGEFMSTLKVDLYPKGEGHCSSAGCHPD
jgi:guanosine-3',5'-bis(diphosphate) 3'-pyrophosphohydrolase